jgi:hypothetical protein
MKRIYMTLALIGALIAQTNAQTIDLESVVDTRGVPCLNNGQIIQPDTTIAPYAIWAVYNNGPDDLVSGDKLMYIFPKSVLGTSGIGVYISTLSAGAPANSFAMVQSNFPVDSINTLLDIDSFNAGATQFSHLMVPRNALVNNKTYGFYLYVIGIGDDPNNPENLDTVKNNFAFQPVKWNCNLSIGDMLKGADKETLTIFPNPASDMISFEYVFGNNSNTSIIRITDLSGRTILVKDFGRNSGVGSKTFKVDVSALPAGTYIAEFSTDDKRAISKFSKK